MPVRRGLPTGMPEEDSTYLVGLQRLVEPYADGLAHELQGLRPSAGRRRHHQASLSELYRPGVGGYLRTDGLVPHLCHPAGGVGRRDFSRLLPPRGSARGPPGRTAPMKMRAAGPATADPARRRRAPGPGPLEATDAGVSSHPSAPARAGGAGTVGGRVDPDLGEAGPRPASPRRSPRRSKSALPGGDSLMPGEEALPRGPHTALPV